MFTFYDDAVIEVLSVDLTNGFPVNLHCSCDCHFRRVSTRPTCLSLMGSGSGSSGGQDLSFLTGTELQNLEQLRAQQLAITPLISTLERFNGETFVNVQPDAVRTGAGALLAA